MNSKVKVWTLGELNQEVKKRPVPAFLIESHFYSNLEAENELLKQQLKSYESVLTMEEGMAKEAHLLALYKLLKLKK